MIGQYGLKKSNSKGEPVRYEAIKTCLRHVCSKARELNATIHMPKIGCGIAGGDWRVIELLIQKCLSNKGIAVFVYDYGN